MYPAPTRLRYILRMPDELREIEGQRCFIADADGPAVRDADAARDLIAEAMSHRAAVLIVPAARLDDAFFQLRSGLAGEILQKAANYRRKFAVIGDVSAHVAASNAFRDLVVESQRSETFFFEPDLTALAQRLAALTPPA
jgi:hypothetical protein